MSAAQCVMQIELNNKKRHVTMYPIVENFVLVDMLQVQRINVKRIHDVVVVLEPVQRKRKIRR